MTIDIVPVETSRQLRLFAQLPLRLYQGQTGFVQPLLMERLEVLRRDKNPYFQHAQAQYWLAFRDGNPAGRISAQIDQLYLEAHDATGGHFGCFDSIDDPAVADRLTTTAEAWLKDRGMRSAMGPFNLSINEEPGLMIDGFATRPMLMTGYAPPYAVRLLEQQRYDKIKDIVYYDYDVARSTPVGGARMIEKIANAKNIRVRQADMRRYHDEIKTIIHIFNDAWAQNWGFVPFTEAELRHIANGMKPLIDTRLVWIAEVAGEPAAMIVGLPNLMGLIGDLDGKLAPFGWAKLLWRLKIKRVADYRILLMGVLQKYQSTPLGSILMASVIEALRHTMQKAGAQSAELGWILENNQPMRRVIESIGGKVSKTYRLYRKDLV